MNKDIKSKKLLILTAVIHVAIFVAGGYILLHLQDDREVETETSLPVTDVHQPEWMTIQTSLQYHQTDIQGRVRAENRLELFPEVQGRVIAGSKPFREGVWFEKGETILQLDSEEARLQLNASRSGFQTLAASLLPDIKLDYPAEMDRYEDWYYNLNPEQTVPDIPEFDHPQLKRFLTSRGIFDNYYRLKSAEHHLEKFTIRAPFSGILSMARVEPGQAVGPQAHLGTLVDPESYLLTATIPQSLLTDISPGDEVELSDHQKRNLWTGIVSRINPSVDPRSQSVEIYLEVGGNGIREGMYLEGVLEAGEPVQVAEIPKSALLRNGFVYVIEDGVTSQKPIQVINIGHDTARVTGLMENDRIIQNASNVRAGLMVKPERR
jgi:membrane fusion protein, multidrug efflux system